MELKKKFAASSRVTFYPYFTAHPLHQATRNGEAEPHAFLFGSGQTEEVIEDFEVKFGWDSRASVGHADFDGVRMRHVLPPAFRGRGQGSRAALPHMRLGVQPHRSLLGRELVGILEQIRDDALEL